MELVIRVRCATSEGEQQQAAEEENDDILERCRACFATERTYSCSLRHRVRIDRICDMLSSTASRHHVQHRYQGCVLQRLLFFGWRSIDVWILISRTGLSRYPKGVTL